MFIIFIYDLSPTVSKFERFVLNLKQNTNQFLTPDSSEMDFLFKKMARLCSCSTASGVNPHQIQLGPVKLEMGDIWSTNVW